MDGVVLESRLQAGGSATRLKAGLQLRDAGVSKSTAPLASIVSRPHEPAHPHPYCGAVERRNPDP